MIPINNLTQNLSFLNQFKNSKLNVNWYFLYAQKLSVKIIEPLTKNFSVWKIYWKSLQLKLYILTTMAYISFMCQKQRSIATLIYVRIKYFPIVYMYKILTQSVSMLLLRQLHKQNQISSCISHVHSYIHILVIIICVEGFMMKITYRQASIF